ncbi:MAG: TIGR02594 family protein, partial [Pseudomonadota bacterium]
EAMKVIGDPKAALGPRGFAEAAGLPLDPPSPSLDQPAPPPAGPAGLFVAARAAAKLVRVFVDEAGREIARVGGSRAWRNNNPGNIRKGDFAANQGAVGDDGQFAIFPTEAAGQAALEALLRGATYGALTLAKAINRYAPPVENDTNAYLDFVVEQTGINPSAILGDLRIADIRKITAAIRRKEGWLPGEERPHGPASETVETGPGGTSSAVGAVDDWMDVARAEAALAPSQRSEWSAAGKHNPRILEYFRVGTSFVANSDETHWCAAFVNYCLETSGHVGTGHPGARSFFWNKKRQFVKLDEPAIGAIGVRRYAPFDDPTWASGSGHVGFVTAIHPESVTLLGGNQSNTVMEQTYKLKTFDGDDKLKSDFVAFMMPVMN